MNKTIDDIIEQIDNLFVNYNRDSRKFTVDYDENTDALFCHYTPYVNDCGYVVLDNLINVTDTSQSDLEKLKEYLKINGIESREGCEWDPIWGWKE